MSLNRARSRLRTRLAAMLNAVAGFVAVGALKLLRVLNRQAMANFTAFWMGVFGPMRREHGIGRANLAAAFPEKSPEEIEKILAGVWDNLGRFIAEFAHIDRFKVYDPAAPPPYDIEYDEASLERFLRLRSDGKPALFFAAHLANWELPAVVAATHGLDASVVYRRPNLTAVADAVIAIRAGSMGTLVSTALDTPIKLADTLARGSRVAMLVDQYYVRGVDVTFFGRRTKANPLLARLVRQIDCPIYGTRVVRLPDRNRFRGEITEAIAPVRDAAGKVDVAGTMQAITNVIEGWVREHPEQWLWVHRRWR